MSKRIIILCDGTWNDEASLTHIHWLNANIARRDGAQIVHYETGVGTDWFNKRTGGALGAGLSRKVKNCYRFLLENYAPGDEVFVFGFSRGAFTARSLCGFVQMVGRIDNVGENNIDRAYTYYRINEPDEDPNIIEAWYKPDTIGALPIRFVGVFDTVGSLGIPFEIEDEIESDDDRSMIEKIGDRLRRGFDAIGDRLRRPITGFHNTELGKGVEEAYHAVAIDERRALFLPTMWTKIPGTAQKFAPDGVTLVDTPQRAEQVWFAGCHGDVGGGYLGEDTTHNEKRHESLSAIPLHWMLEKAMAAGLVMVPNAFEVIDSAVAGLALCPQNDSYTKSWKRLDRGSPVATPLARPMGNDQRLALNPAGDFFPRVVQSTDFAEAIHASVQARKGKTVEVRHDEDGPRSIVYGEHRPVPDTIKL